MTEAEWNRLVAPKSSNVIKFNALVAFDAQAAARRASRFTGAVCCARVYVEFSGKVDVAGKRALATAGFNVTPRPNSKRTCIYVGYDNGTGIEYGRAIAIAETFRNAGVSAHEDADMD